MSRSLRIYRTGRLANIVYTDVTGDGKLSFNKATAEHLHRRLTAMLADWPDSHEDLIEQEAERMFHERYGSSWNRATGEKPYWIPFATHDQACSLGGKEAQRFRDMAREALSERGLLPDSQGTLKGVK